MFDVAGIDLIDAENKDVAVLSSVGYPKYRLTGIRYSNVMGRGPILAASTCAAR